MSVVFGGHFPVGMAAARQAKQNGGDLRGHVAGGGDDGLVAPNPDF
jgi:ABC-type branched-subunit amino acid transport system substrate-binding protein